MMCSHASCLFIKCDFYKRLVCGLLALILLSLISSMHFQLSSWTRKKHLSLATGQTNESMSKTQAQIAIVVLTAKRPEVHQLLRQLLTHKPESGFRILVSQDGKEKRTAAVLQHFASKGITVLRIPGCDCSVKGAIDNKSYARIARHHKRVLDRVLLELDFQYAVILEDDLLIAPDFYQYFKSLSKALDSDESIFCVSAWNDNGQADLSTNDPQLLHRTDFFPGLGWMINKRIWLSVRPVWPATEFDAFLRYYMLENELVCVRPELSRTFNIGRHGGQEIDTDKSYYHNFLSRMLLNQHKVILSESAINRVIGRSADRNLDKYARSLPVTELSSFLSMPKPPSEVRLRFRTAQEFVALAEQIGAVTEVWFGAPRASILGITVLTVRGSRVYIVPDVRLPIDNLVVHLSKTTVVKWLPSQNASWIARNSLNATGQLKRP